MDKLADDLHTKLHTKLIKDLDLDNVDVVRLYKAR